jgi:hypothetical protein
VHRRMRAKTRDALRACALNSCMKPIHITVNEGAPKRMHTLHNM